MDMAGEQASRQVAKAPRPSRTVAIRSSTYCYIEGNYRTLINGMTILLLGQQSLVDSYDSMIAASCLFIGCF
jgi:hypothetical protein